MYIIRLINIIYSHTIKDEKAYMPNIKSKIKRVKTSEKARLENKSFRSSVKTAVKRARLGISIKDEKLHELIDHANSMLDKAVTKGVYTKNKAGRTKSRLMKGLHHNTAILQKDHEQLDEIKKGKTNVKPVAPKVEKTTTAKAETTVKKTTAAKPATTVKKTTTTKTKPATTVKKTTTAKK